MHVTSQIGLLLWLLKLQRDGNTVQFCSVKLSLTQRHVSYIHVASIRIGLILGVGFVFVGARRNWICFIIHSIRAKNKTDFFHGLNPAGNRIQSTPQFNPFTDETPFNSLPVSSHIIIACSRGLHMCMLHVQRLRLREIGFLYVKRATSQSIYVRCKARYVMVYTSLWNFSSGMGWRNICLICSVTKPRFGWATHGHNNFVEGSRVCKHGFDIFYSNSVVHLLLAVPSGGAVLDSSNPNAAIECMEWGHSISRELWDFYYYYWQSHRPPLVQSGLEFSVKCKVKNLQERLSTIFFSAHFFSL